MDDLDKLLNSLPDDFRLDLSKMPEIISLEKKYNALGSKRLDELLKYGSPTQFTGGEKSLFIFGYSECGQAMDDKIKELEAKLEIALKLSFDAAKWSKEDNLKVIELETDLQEAKEFIEDCRKDHDENGSNRVPMLVPAKFEVK